VIKGFKTCIRPIQEADITELAQKSGDIDALGAFLPTQMVSPSQLQKEYADHGFQQEHASRYLITDHENHMLGMVWAFKSVPYFDALEVGYQVFSDKDRGKGIATEALKLLVDYLFESRQVNRLEVRVATENIASERVAMNAGFTREGTHREAAFSKGRLFDMHSYALLRREWRLAD